MRVLLFIFCVLPLWSTAQLKEEYVWRINSENDKKSTLKMTSLLANGGYKLDYDSLTAGRLIIWVKDIHTLAPALKKKNGISITLYDDTFISLGSEAIQQQLIVQKDLAFSITERFNEESANKSFRLALKGKSQYNGPAPYAWHIDFGTISSYNDALFFEITKKGKSIAKLSFNLVMGDMARKLKEFETAECEPIDRYSHFLNLKGLKNQDVPPKKHILSRGKYYSKTFNLNFSYDSYTYNKSEVARIVKYIQDSSLTIKRAYIRGLSSIEGDSLHNTKLQNKRAAVLWEIFENYASRGTKIEGDYKEAWLLFRTQMKNDSITEFDSLSTEEIRSLFKDKKYRTKYGSYLQTQRISKLYLRLYKSYSNSFTVWKAGDTALKQYNKLVKAEQILSKSEREKKKRQAIANILGIEEALARDVRLGKLSQDELLSYYPLKKLYSDDLQMGRYYLMQRNWRKGILPVLFTLEEMILSAYRITLPEIKSPHFSDANRPLRKAVGVQMFAYSLIKNKEIAPDLYFSLIYPDDPKYYHLEMNKLYFNEKYSIVDEQTLAAQASISGANPGAISKESQSRYYFYLKKHLLEGNEDINAQILRHDTYYFVDVYDLLYPNLYGWNEIDSTFYDEEIGVEVMGNLIKRLMPTILCPYQKYELALDFHLKVLHRATLATVPTKQFNRSYKFVKNYYLKKAARIDGAAAYNVAAQLVFLNHLFYKNESIKDAYVIMYPAFKKGKLDQRQYWFFHDLSKALGRENLDFNN